LALFLVRSFHRRLIDLPRTTYAAETRYRTLVEQLPAVTFIDEVEDAAPFAIHPLYVSPQVESLFGYPVERWLADSSLWRSILHPDDRQAAIDLADRIYETREPYATEYRIVAADGRILWIQEASVIIRARTGSPRSGRASCSTSRPVTWPRRNAAATSRCCDAPTDNAVGCSRPSSLRKRPSGSGWRPRSTTTRCRR
jgi:PAS domain S-box-containing protein